MLSCRSVQSTLGVCEEQLWLLPVGHYHQCVCLQSSLRWTEISWCDLRLSWKPGLPMFTNKSRGFKMKRLWRWWHWYHTHPSLLFLLLVGDTNTFTEDCMHSLQLSANNITEFNCRFILNVIQNKHCVFVLGDSFIEQDWGSIDLLTAKSPSAFSLCLCFFLDQQSLNQCHSI